MGSTKSHPITVRVPLDVWRWLIVASERTDVSVSKVVVQAVREYVEREVK